MVRNKMQTRPFGIATIYHLFNRHCISIYSGSFNANGPIFSDHSTVGITISNWQPKRYKKLFKSVKKIFAQSLDFYYYELIITLRARLKRLACTLNAI